MHKKSATVKPDIVSIGVACLLLLLISCSMIQRKANPYLERDISGPVTLSPKWLEITPSEPLKPEREINSIILTFAAKHELNEQSNGFRFPDGEVVLPEVQLVDQDGKVYPLGIATIGTTGVGFSSFNPATHLNNLPTDKLFTTVRIRCDKPIQCAKITWSGYNMRDRK